MATEQKLLTADDLLNLPDDGRRYELLDGRLVELAPTGFEHGGVANTFAYFLTSHVRPRGLGRVLVGDVGVILGRNPDRVRGPDVCFIASERIPNEGLPASYSEIVPDLVVEVVSPHDTASEIQAKIEEWLRRGARLAWVAYPSRRSIVAYRGLDNVRVYTEDDDIDGAPVLPDFAVRVSELFS